MAISAIQSSEFSQHSIIGKLASAASEQAVGNLAPRQSGDTTLISGYAQIRVALDRLQSAASDLAGPAAFGSLVAASSNPSVVSENLTNTSVKGSFEVEVSQFASAKTLATSSPSSTNSLLGSGEKTTRSFQLGESSGTKFTADEVRAVEKVSIDARNPPLDGVALAVNAADAGATLDLRRTGSAQLSVRDHSDNVIAQKAENFFNAFNEVQTKLKQFSAGDVPPPPVARDLKARLNETLEAENHNASAFGGLAGIGIQSDAVGNLKLDTLAFQNALGIDRAAVTKIVTHVGAGFVDLLAVVVDDLAKVADHEVSRLPASAGDAQARSASGISLEVAKGFDQQYQQLSGLVRAVDKTDQTLHGLLLQGEAAQASQSSLLNRLNSLANLATP